jgi:hypothetical protein
MIERRFEKLHYFEVNWDLKTSNGLAVEAFGKARREEK